ncbi:MAG: RNA methyltransferase [Betaproteobacteria bacterium]|jgi:23S rRNA (adenine2503-C2)-methyltransferase|nr:RNA methyltransferase [Betaproteobacteria bacterium]NBS48123.1 RNA methyltransferase [Betaproteobacteria bacterium]
MQIRDLRNQMQTHGALPRHADRLLRLWSQGLPQDHGRRRIDSFLPARLVQALPELQSQWAQLARLQSQHLGEDGSARLLVQLADGQTCESVLLAPGRIPGLCVSTQIGCAVGCRFCMTGRDGLLRQLGSAEIVAQVALARTLRPVRKVVFMGMGEPAHNLDNVMEAIELLGTLGDIGHKNLVFSTVGDARVFDRLPRGPVKPALALSLHTTRADLRAELLPRAPQIAPDALIEAGDRYARDSGYPLQVQWTLLEGINDTEDEIAGLVRLLAGRFAVLNLIPYNTVPDLPYRRPAWEHAAQMARTLHRAGVLTKLRRSAGQDVDAGCGQLRARHSPVRVVRAAALAPANDAPSHTVAL